MTEKKNNGLQQSVFKEPRITSIPAQRSRTNTYFSAKTINVALGHKNAQLRPPSKPDALIHPAMFCAEKASVLRSNEQKPLRNRVWLDTVGCLKLPK